MLTFGGSTYGSFDLPIGFAFASALRGGQGLLYQPLTRDSGQ